MTRSFAWPALALALLATGEARAQSAAPAAAPPPEESRAPAASPPAPAQTPVPAPTPSELRARRVAVDVESSRPSAVLERRVTTNDSSGVWLVFPWRSHASEWEQVCVAPCRAAELDRYSTYRVAEANHLTSSRPFTLPQGGDAVHLKIDAGDATWHHVGRTMSALGGAALIVGVALLVAAPTIESSSRERDYRVGGGVTGGAGLVLMAVGLPLAIATQSTVYADANERVARDGKPRLTWRGLVF
jgi:hypothetical protein